MESDESNSHVAIVTNQITFFSLDTILMCRNKYITTLLNLVWYSRWHTKRRYQRWINWKIYCAQCTNREWMSKNRFIAGVDQPILCIGKESTTLKCQINFNENLLIFRILYCSLRWTVHSTCFVKFRNWIICLRNIIYRIRISKLDYFIPMPCR